MKPKIPEKVKSDWYLWLFPVIALLITGWLIADYYRQHGPVIKIVFEEAGGIQVEKTKLRYRGVAVGTVTDLAISEDMKDVVATVVLRKDAKQFAVEGSKFSMVMPKVGFQGISGLETLFEGSYIEVLPGKSDGAEKNEFKAQTSSNSTETRDETSSYVLAADNAESVSVGNAVTYRGLKVGTITVLSLSKDSQQIQIQINIENKYTKLIRDNTQFWRKVGVHAKLGLFGSEIKVNSMDSIMNGGIEFATPNEIQPMAKANHRFAFGAGPPKGYEKWNPKLEFP